MLVIIFSYNRYEMLSALCKELEGCTVIVIDDGSEWMNNKLPHYYSSTHTFIKTHHEGKQGFWKKWVMARQIALGSGHDYFLFLPDDISEVNLDTIKAMTKQGWDNYLFAVNIINCNRENCWGHFRTKDQEDIEIEDTVLKEVGFVDCGFLTNRMTMENVDVHEVSPKWHDRKDKSSGVGYQLTESMRTIGVRMMMPHPGLCFYDGKHESVMHPKPVNNKPKQKRRVVNTNGR